MAVTNGRLICKAGLVSLTTQDIDLESIQTVMVDKTIPGLLLGYGAARLQGAGKNWIEVKVVDMPVRLRREIQRAREGQHIQPIAAVHCIV